MRGYKYTYSWPPDEKNQLIGKTLILGIKAGGEGDDRG